MKIPFTTGLLVGIGESAEEREETLAVIRDLHEQHGHIQEIIIQNFRAKPGTPMAQHGEPSVVDILRTVATARVLLGPEMNIQLPPNLSLGDSGTEYLVYLKAGINDWGGVSPLTIDYVNPEAPWPHLDKLRDQLHEKGLELRARFPVYPEYILYKSHYLPESLRDRLQLEADPRGYFKGSRFPISSSRLPGDLKQEAGNLKFGI